MRKSMVELSIEPSFNGQTPSYEDLIIAGFETGVITNADLQEMQNLELLWNPKKTFWEKSRVWIQAFIPVATVVIPPPYNIIASVSMVIIDLATNKEEPQYEHSYFREL